MPCGSYQPFVPARRPGGKPDLAPQYRVLVHQKYLSLWHKLVQRIGLQSAQRFWDHVAQSPGKIPLVGKANILRGKAGKPKRDGFSRTIHYEISGAGRIDYQYSDSYQTSSNGDPHRVVFIFVINLSSH